MKSLLQVLTIIALTLFIGCKSYPERIPGEPLTCYESRVCMRENEKNHDKSSCVILLNSCAEIAKEVDNLSIKDYIKCQQMK